jgi:hypothetical protein
MNLRDRNPPGTARNTLQLSADPTREAPARLAVATATDAMPRSIIGFGDGVGLRAGTFHTDYGAAWTTTLADCAFAEDVTFNKGTRTRRT